MEKVIILYVLQSHKFDFLAFNDFMCIPRGLFPPFLTSVVLLVQHTPVHCSAIKQSVLPAKLGEHRKHHCGTPLSGT